MTTHDDSPTTAEHTPDLVTSPPPTRAPVLSALGGGVLLVAGLVLDSSEEPDEGISTERLRAQLEDGMERLALQVLGESRPSSASCSSSPAWSRWLGRVVDRRTSWT